MAKTDAPIDPRKQQEIDRKADDFLNFINTIPDNITKQVKNPYAAASPASFNPNSLTDQNKNFERYYSHPSYDKLGFNPWTDNEVRYNENSSGLGDMWRATKTAGKLAVTGFVSPLRSYKDLFTGNYFVPDEASANEMRYYNTVGASSRGGASGFASNLITNSGYTMGVVGEALIENFALASATAATGGVAAPAWISRLGKFGKDLGKYTETLGELNKTREGLNNYNTAKAFWQSVKTNTFNPLSGTLEAFDIARNSSIGALAKASTTAGGFFRDLQQANLAISEAKMEGATVQKDLEEELVSKYKAEHGGLEPSYQEMLNIKQTALDAGTKDLIWNVPTIFLTNKITFGPLLKTFDKPTEYALRNGTKFIEKDGKLIKSTFKNKLLNSLKPKNLYTVPIRYFKENFAEGIQETSQDIIAGTAKEYYKGIYNSPTKQGHDYGVGENYGFGVFDALTKSVADQFSGKGFETFASGFLMGGLIKIAGAPIRALQGGYSEYKKTKSAYADETLKTLNEIYKDPLKFFSPGIINYANAGESVTGQSQAEESNDQKAWLDFENASLTSNVITALDTNTYDIFLDKLKAIKTMDVESIKEAYGQDGQEVLGKIDRIIGRAEIIKDNHQKWNERFPNPFNPKQYNKESEEFNKEALGYVSWENAKKVAIFNDTAFQRNVNRIQGITNDIIQTGELKNLNANDISILFSPRTIRNELRLLEDEVEILEASEVKGDTKAAAVKRSKQKRLENLVSDLEGYYVGQALDNLSEEQKETFKAADRKKTSINKLKKSYNDYISHLATSQVNVVPVSGLDLDVSFEKLLDLHELKQENLRYTEVINVLADPKGFINQFERLNDVFKDLYESRSELLKKSIENTQSKIEDNSILQVLYDRGFVMSPEDVEELLKNKTIPKQFYDINTKQVVDDRSSGKYNEFKDLVENYVEATKPTDTETETNKTTASPQDQSVDVEESEVDIEQGLSELNIDVAKKFEEVKTGQELKALESELTDLITKTHFNDALMLAALSKEVDNRVKTKESQLLTEISFDNLKVGNIVEMTDPEYKYMRVIKKSGEEITFEKTGGMDKLRVVIKSSNLKRNIRLKFAENMETVQTQATPQEKTNVKKNLDSVEKLIGNRELVAEEVEIALKNKQQAQVEFLEELGCK